MQCHCCAGPTKKAGRFQNQHRRVQRFQCKRCGKTFSEDQPLEGLRVEPDKITQIIKLLCEGIGIRACARLTGCHIETVLNVLSTVGAACAALLDRKVRNLETSSIQLDELWSRVGCRQRKAETDPERGDFYTFLAIEARTKLIITHLTGKRNYQNTDAFVADLATRITGRVQITSDAWPAYHDTVRKHLLDRLDFAIMQKIYGTEDNPKDPARRYSPPKCTGVKVNVCAGAPRPERINTSFVERSNLSVRHFNKRFARLGLGYSRKLENHRSAISLFVASYNFCKVHTTLGTTPGHGAGITDRPWKIEELIEAATN